MPLEPPLPPLPTALAVKVLALVPQLHAVTGQTRREQQQTLASVIMMPLPLSLVSQMPPQPLLQRASAPAWPHARHRYQQSRAQTR